MSGPSLKIPIKLQAIMSLLLAPFFVGCLRMLDQYFAFGDLVGCLSKWA